MVQSTVRVETIASTDQRRTVHIFAHYILHRSHRRGHYVAQPVRRFPEQFLQNNPPAGPLTVSTRLVSITKKTPFKNDLK